MVRRGNQGRAQLATVAPVDCARAGAFGLVVVVQFVSEAHVVALALDLAERSRGGTVVVGAFGALRVGRCRGLDGGNGAEQTEEKVEADSEEKRQGKGLVLTLTGRGEAACKKRKKRKKRGAGSLE